MKLYINDKIKDFRKEKKWTQEELAEKLNVSPQAVSRWETNTTFPDIELLPEIANIFEISVDELLGVNDMLNNDRIETLIKEANSYYNTGEIDKVVSLLEQAKKEFPRNIKITLNLIQALDSLGGENRKDTCKRVIKLGSQIIDRLTDIEDKCSLYQTMAYAHLELGNKEQAKIFAEKLPSMAFASSLVLSSILEGEEQIEVLQANIQELMIKLVIQVGYLSSQDTYNKEQQITIYKKINSLLELMYEDNDYGYGNWLLSRNNMYIAEIYADMNDEKNTIKYISIAANYCKNFDSIGNETLRHTSLINNRLTFNIKENFWKDYPQFEKEILLNKLKEKRYDFLKDNEEFKKIVESLKK